MLTIKRAAHAGAYDSERYVLERTPPHVQRQADEQQARLPCATVLAPPGILTFDEWCTAHEEHLQQILACILHRLSELEMEYRLVVPVPDVQAALLRCMYSMSSNRRKHRSAIEFK